MPAVSRTAHVCVAFVASLVILAGASVQAQAATQAFTPTGEYTTWVVPAGVTGITVDAVGGAGGNGSWTPGIGGDRMALGAPGGTVKGQIPVTPGETLRIFVGRGGGHGSGMTPGSGGAGGDYTGGDGGVGVLSNAGGGGGGATTITRANGTVLLVAGGGGAGGADGLNFDPKLGRFVGGHGGSGGASPGRGGGGDSSGTTGQGGAGGGDTNYKHGGKGGIGVGTTGSGGGGGGGHWAGTGGDAGEARVTLISFVVTGGGGGGGGTNYVIPGSGFVAHGVDSQSAGNDGRLSITTSNETSTSLSVEAPGFDGPNNRGILFTANVAGAGMGGTVAFTAVFNNGASTNQTQTLCAAVPVVNGVATCAPTLAAGDYNVTASFSGDLASRPSSSNTVFKEISKWSQVVFVDTPTKVDGGSTVRLTVRVDGAYGAGKVSFSAGAHCTGNLYSSNGAWYASCDVVTSTSSVTLPYTASFVPPATTDPRVRMAPSSATIHIQTVKLRDPMVHNIVVGSSTINLGQSVAFTACRAFRGSANLSCPGQSYPYWVTYDMPGASCTQKWYTGWPGWNNFVYECTPASPGRHTFTTSYRVTENGPYGICDDTPVGASCPSGWWDPTASTTINVLGPPAKLGVKVATLTGANAAMQYEGMNMSVDLRDSADNVVSGTIPSDVQYQVVKRTNNQPDPSIGLCRGNVCTPYVNDTVRVRATSASTGMSGYLDVTVYGSSPVRDVTVDGPAFIRADDTNHSPFELKVLAPWDNQETNWYLDGRRVCVGSVTRAPADAQGRFAAGCTFFGETMPSVGVHELTAVYREIDRAASSAMMTFEVVGAPVSLKTPTFARAIAGEEFDVDVHGTDANGTDTGSLRTANIYANIDEGLSCLPGRLACFTTVAGPHQVTVTYLGFQGGYLRSTGTVLVEPADIASLVLTPPALPVPVGTVPDVAVAAKDRFGNDVPDAVSKVTWKLDGVDCPIGGCLPTNVARGAYAITATYTPTSGAPVTASTTFTTTAGIPASVQFTNLPTSSRIAGTEFTYGLTGEDAYGNPLDPTYVRTNVQVVADSGEACTVDWAARCTINAMGTRTLIARNALGAIVGTGVVEIAPEGYHDVRVTPSASSVTAGERVVFTAEFVDRFGNAFESIHPSYTSYSSPGASCASSEDEAWCTFDAVGAYSVAVAASNWPYALPPVQVAVTAGPAVSYALVATETGPAKAGLARSYTITAKDHRNNTAVVDITDLAATIGGGQCFVSEPVGVPTVTCLGFEVGAKQVALRSANDVVATASVQVDPGLLHHLDVAGDTDLTAGVASAAYQVRALDPFGNLISTNDPAIAMVVDGVACVQRVCTPQVATVQDGAQVRASLGDVDRYFSATVAAGAPSKYSMVLARTTFAAAEAITPTVQSTDAFDNPTGLVADAQYVLTGASGTIHCTISPCAGTKVGAHVLTAYRGGQELATRSITITPGAAASLKVSQDLTTIDPGGAATFAAATYDVYDNHIADIVPAITSTDADLACDGNACTGVRAKTYVLTVSGAGFVVPATLTVRRGIVTSLVTTPAVSSILAGGSVSIAGTTSDGFGNDVVVTSDPGFVVTAQSPGLTCTGIACSATKPGIYTARASFAGRTADTTITVSAAALAKLRVSTTDTDLAVGRGITFSAMGLDAYDNETGAQTTGVTYTIGGNACAANVCTIPSFGPHTVTASTAGGITGTTSVTATAGSLDHIAVAPVAPATAGTDTTFTVTGYDAADNSRGPILDGVTITGPEAVSCANRTCNSERADTYVLTVTAQGASTTTTLTVEPAALAYLEVGTFSSVIAGMYFPVDSEGFDRFHNLIGYTTTVASYTIDGGQCSGATCRALTAGPATIRAAYGGATGETVVSVLPGVAEKVSLDLSASVLTVGGPSTTAKAYVTDAYDNPVSNAAVSFTSNLADHGGPVFGAMVTRLAAGTYATTLTPGRVAATYWVSASLPDAPIATRTSTRQVTQLAGRPATVAVSLADASIVADAASSTVATAAVEDLFGNPVPGASVTFSSTGAQTFGAVTSTTPGTYVSTVSSSTLAGVSTITARVTMPGDPGAPRTGSAVLTQRVGVPTTIAVSSSAASIIANAQSTARITITVRDANGNGVPGREFLLGATGSSRVPTFGAVTDNGDGTYSVPVTSSTKAGSYLLTATDDEDIELVDGVMLTLAPGAASAADLTLDPAIIVADGVTTTTATVVATDDFGNRVPDLAVTIGTSGGQDAGVVTSPSVGVYTSVLTSTTTSGVSTITADISSTGGATAIADLRGTAQLTQAPGVATQMVLTSTATQLVANGEDELTLTATLTDAHGNGVPNHSVTFAAVPAGRTPSFGVVTDHGDGRYTTVVTSSTKPGAYELTASASSVAPAIEPRKVAITQVPGQPAAATLTLAPATIVADGASSTTATVHVADRDGNAVPGASVALTSDGAQVVGAVTDAGAGDYTATITSTKVAGSATIRAAVTVATSSAPARIVTARLVQRAGAATALAVRLAPSELVADGASRTTATATLTDVNGNVVSDGAPVVFAVDTGASVGAVAMAADGTSSAQITSGMTVGAATVTARSGSLVASAPLTIKVRTSAPGTLPISEAGPAVLLPAPPTTTPVTGGTMPVTVTCPSGAIGSCTMVVSVTPGSETPGQAASGGTTTVTSVTVTLQPGQSTTVNAPLTADLIQQLTAKGVTTVSVTLTVRDEVGNEKTITVQRTIATSRYKGMPLASQRLVLKRGTVLVKVMCPKTAVKRCSGTLDLSAIVDRQVLRRGKWTKPYMGTRRFTVKSGATQFVRVRVNGLAAHLLRTRPLINVHVVARTRDAVTRDFSTRTRVRIALR